MRDVLDAEMDRAGPRGFAQPVVGVVVVVRKHRLPALDQARRHRLRADVHQPPLREFVFLELDVAAFDGVENVLRPRHQQPDHGAAFGGNRVNDPLRTGPLEQHRPAPDQETAEPVHLRPGMIQWRNAEEGVFAGLAVVILLGLASVHQAAVGVEDRLGESGRAGGEVDRRVLVVAQRNLRGFARTVGDQAVVGLRERRAVLSDVKERLDARNPVADVFHPPGEFRPENQHIDIRQLQAVFDLLGGVAEVHRHRDRPAFEDSKIDRQPFETVHQEDRHPTSLADVAGEQQIGHAVGLAVEAIPGDFGAEGVGAARFDQRIFPPGHVASVQRLRIEFDQRDVIPVNPRVFLQNLRNRHHKPPCSFQNLITIPSHSEFSRKSFSFDLFPPDP